MDSSKMSGPSFEVGPLRGGTFAAATGIPASAHLQQQSSIQVQPMPTSVRPIIRGDGLFTVLWRGKFLILAALALSFITAVGFLRFKPRVYSASAKLMLSSPPAALGPGTDDPAAREADRATQCALIESYPVIESALRSPALSKLTPPGRAFATTQWIKANLTAEVDRLDDLLTVSFNGRNPQEAADVVNEVIRSYASFDVQRTSEEAGVQLKLLQAEQTKQQATLAEQARDIHDYKEANRTIVFEPASNNIVLNGVHELAEALTQAQLAAADAKAVADATQSAATRRLFELALLKEQALEAQLKEQQSKAMALDAKVAEYDRMESDYRHTQGILDLLDKRIREISIGGSSGAISVRVLEPADPLLVSVQPNSTKVLGGGCAAGIVLGVLGAILRDRLDNRVRSAEEVSSLTGSPVLGVIPRLPRFARARAKRNAAKSLRKLWMQPSSDCGEVFRAIRTSLCLSSKGPGAGSVFLVSSPGRGDGKSTFIANLAVAMAQAGRRVLLIDCDMRRPMQHTLMGVANEIGVSDVLQECSVEVLKDGIQQTWLPGLSVLACGPLPHNPSELLSSDRLALLITVVRECFDFVLIDSPPLTAVTDAQLLSTVCDETLLVVRANRSTRAAIESSRDALLRVGRRVWGAILNEGPAEMSVYRNGYGVHPGAYAGSGLTVRPVDEFSELGRTPVAARRRSSNGDLDGNESTEQSTSHREVDHANLVPTIGMGGAHERVG